MHRDFSIEGDNSQVEYYKKYSSSMPVMIYNLCLTGATEEDICREIGIGLKTLSQWKVEHPEVENAIKRGKLQADSQVAASLYKMAVGYWYDSDEVVKDSSGNYITIKVSKYVKPNAWAANKWLSKRQPEKWGEHQGREASTVTNIYSVVNNKVDFTGFTEEEKSILENMGLRYGGAISGT